MSLDISLQTTSYQVGNRQWLLSEPDTKLNVTLDISKFTGGTHFPNGYIPSGTVVGIVTATGLAGPYSNAASDGTETAYGITYGDAKVTQANGTNTAKVSISVVVNDCIVSKAKLPFQSGAGFADANGITDLKNITFVA
ncbi:head decoration protein [Mycolicibacterium bacteremicum]|uniref:Head decoration protein n=1 Tax=Mycolicibacterium bacteremicum TaxID=564198 RepID=A0A1W9Z0E9_MYCBA|nr:head decoration protein [Mycolicibacterium bacteremicum]MCV7434821.1 head decoration protein [Mycolicibacterium bacteremicum]ORA05808.1 hypothetical protein BST17_08625 [Mycolicibacterium bacteremicum]